MIVDADLWFNNVRPNANKERAFYLDLEEMDTLPQVIQTRHIGAYFLLGGVICLGAGHWLNLAPHVDSKNSMLTHQMSYAQLLRSYTSLQEKDKAYQKKVEYLTQLLSDKSELNSLLAMRVDSLIPELRNDQDKLVRAGRLDLLTDDLLTKWMLLQIIPSGSPLKYHRPSSLYDKHHLSIYGKSNFHQAIDLACRIGDPILASADGVIEAVVTSKKGLGNFITVRHGFGFRTSYAQLSRFKVRSGEFVRKGDEIATCGNAGNSSTSSYLHYEVRFAMRLLNPKLAWSIQDFMLPLEKEKGLNWL